MKIDQAARLRAARGLAGITQEEMADRLGVSQSSVQRYESGTRVPRSKRDEILDKVSEVSGLTSDFFARD